MKLRFDSCGSSGSDCAVGCMTRVEFPAGAEIFSPHHCHQTGSGAHLILLPNGCWG